MHVFVERDRLYFTGTVRQFREFLKTLPAGVSLRAYLAGRLH